MSGASTTHESMEGRDYEAISPYLRRPIRTLKQYLRERALSRKGTHPRGANADPSNDGETHDGDSGHEDEKND
jgi:hypothetical protein